MRKVGEALSGNSFVTSTSMILPLWGLRSILSVNRIETTAELAALTACILTLVHLKELHLYGLTDGCSHDAKSDLMNALKRNGSLERVEVSGFRYPGWAEPPENNRPFFTDAGEQEKVRTYCHRNKMLPVTIANPRLDSATAGGGGGDDDDDNTNNDTRAPIALYPNLSHRALQCPGTGPSIAFGGLVAASGLIRGSATIEGRKRTGPSAFVVDPFDPADRKRYRTDKAE